MPHLGRNIKLLAVLMGSLLSPHLCLAQNTVVTLGTTDYMMKRYGTNVEFKIVNRLYYNPNSAGWGDLYSNTVTMQSTGAVNIDADEKLNKKVKDLTFWNGREDQKVKAYDELMWVYELDGSGNSKKSICVAPDRSPYFGLSQDDLELTLADLTKQFFTQGYWQMAYQNGCEK